MKKLLLISFFTFFSISAIAETSLRCKFYSYCEDLKCSDKVQVSYSQLVYSDGWFGFGKKISLDGKDYTEKAYFLEDIIRFGKYTFYKKSNLLKGIFVNRERKESQNEFLFGKKNYSFATHEYICSEIN